LCNGQPKDLERAKRDLADKDGGSPSRNLLTSCWLNRWSKDFLEAGKKRLAGDLCKVRRNVHEPSDYNESLKTPAFFGNQLCLKELQHRRRFVGPWM